MLAWRTLRLFGSGRATRFTCGLATATAAFFGGRCRAIITNTSTFGRDLTKTWVFSFRLWRTAHRMHTRCTLGFLLLLL